MPSLRRGRPFLGRTVVLRINSRQDILPRRSESIGSRDLRPQIAGEKAGLYRSIANGPGNFLERDSSGPLKLSMKADNDRGHVKREAGRNKPPAEGLRTPGRG